MSPFPHLNKMKSCHPSWSNNAQSSQMHLPKSSSSKEETPGERKAAGLLVPRLWVVATGKQGKVDGLFTVELELTGDGGDRVEILGLLSREVLYNKNAIVFSLFLPQPPFQAWLGEG